MPAVNAQNPSVSLNIAYAFHMEKLVQTIANALIAKISINRSIVAS